MNYAVILSGGIGSRVENIDIPKQYYKVNDVPIIIYTLKTFVDINCFDYICIPIDDKYKKYFISLLEKYFDYETISKITLVNSGSERIDSIINAVNVIEKNEINDEDIILIHDGVRPFVTERIILENLEAVKEFSVCATSAPVNDTIFQSQNGEFVDNIPVRSTLFCGQSPDTFNLKKFVYMINNITDDQKRKITGTADICKFFNIPIKMIKGDNINFKITTSSDLKMAELILKDKGF